MRKVFNIEKAKAGAKVVTRDGRHARILAYDLKDEDYKVAIAIQSEESYSEEVYSFTEEGKFYLNGKQSDKDLFIEEEPTIRPYANAEELDEAVKKHGVILKNSFGRRLTITGYDDKNVSVGMVSGCKYETLLKSYTWIDDTPCGVWEGGDNE